MLVGLVFLPHICGAELGLCLALEIRLLDLDAYSSDDALTAVLGFVILLEIVLEGLRDGLPERRQVGASVSGVLAVDERGDILTVGVAVCEHDFDVFILEVDRLIQRSLGHVLLDEIEQSVV